MTRLSVLVLVAATAGAAMAGVACDEKKPASESSRPDGGTSADKYATADPKLEKALRAVASPSASADNNGPPPSGIFAPGAADQRHAHGVRTKVDVLEAGGDPKITLTSTSEAARASSYGPAALEVVLQMGPRSAIAIDYVLLFGPAKKDEGGSDWLVGEVKRAAPSKALGPPAPGLEKDISSLDGTQVRVELGLDGRATNLELKPAKAMKEDFDRLAQSAAESVVLSTVPLPSTPVGVGARWIAETRMPLSGLDVIAYRAYFVKSIDGERLHLTLEGKAYAADKQVQLAGVPKGATLEQFEATSHGELELVRGETLARKGDIEQRVAMVFAGPGGAQPAQRGQAPGQQPGNMLTAQLTTQSTFVRGEDLRTVSRQSP